MLKFILLIVFFKFISISPKTTYMLGMSLKRISSFFYGVLNMKTEQNGSLINLVGYLAKNLSHPIK